MRNDARRLFLRVRCHGLMGNGSSNLDACAYIPLPLNERIVSVSGRSNLRVALGTTGTYTLDTVDGYPIASADVTFAADPSQCSQVQVGYVFPVVQSVFYATHSMSFLNATLCIAGAGLTGFRPTQVQFSVVPARLQRLIVRDATGVVIGQAAETSSVDSSATTLSIPEWSSGSIEIVGPNADWIQQIRFSSRQNCMNPPYTYGPLPLHWRGVLPASRTLCDSSTFRTSGTTWRLTTMTSPLTYSGCV